jgi:cellulose synthase/poly-beta-1,6-N-acetylglucosamine synthase-like glycosyltransferase
VTALSLAATALAVLVSAPCWYLLSMVPVAALARARGRARQRRHPDPEAGHLAFVVPAHNEETDIEATLAGLTQRADGECSIHVVADNCTDRTAELVRGFAADAGTGGATVVLWERQDPEKKAKGFALEWALPQVFEWSDARGTPARFVCIVDADAALSEGSVRHARLNFAQGHDVLQSAYVFGEGLGMRARIMRIASAAFCVRGLARSTLQLSDTLKGNGMWFRRDVLEQVPWCAYSLAEDLEYTLTLVRAGYRVHVLPESQVYGRLAATTQGEQDQRLRWEGGRWAVVKVEVPRLLKDFLRGPNLVTLDLLVELIIPPLGLLVGIEAAVLVATLFLPGPAWLLVLAGWAALGLYVVASVFVVGLPVSNLLALVYVPFYVAWKVLLLPKTVAASRSKRWVRTSR